MTFSVTDPERCTDYERSDAQLEEFLIFCIAVAGKNARTTRKVMGRFWQHAAEVGEVGGPFRILRSLSMRFNAPGLLKNSGLGCYTLKASAMIAAAHSGLDLRTCSAEDLEKIKGIGRKTSRFFILHSRPGARHAVLDTHLLRFLRDLGVDAPESTPQSKSGYARVEAEFLKLVPAGTSVAEFDLRVWNLYSSGSRSRK